MNPRLSRHVFADTPTDVLRGLHNACLFLAENGETCVPLQPCWPELLADCADLGPVALVSQSNLAQFAACVPCADFAPVPGSSELVELNSGFGADTALWSHALAVEEHVPDGRLFSLQFFGRDSRGLWKMLLTHDTPIEQFAAMVRHYASGSPPPPALPPPLPPSSRLVELQLMGCALAHETPEEMLATLLCEARRQDRRVKVEIGGSGLWHAGTMFPRGLERCGRAFHAYDYGMELHITLVDSSTLWHVRNREGWSLEVLDGSGQLAVRLG